ncbi:MAG: hypothetical protein JST18_08255 [Bacteroidetes bacterium]|nr:hypothetical protein [Bacteroidota bacterium]
MKRLVIAITVLSLASGMLAQSILLLHYELEKDYYSQVLCINKEKPSLHCEGKCQLRKELEQEEKNEQNPAVPLKTKPGFNPLYFHTISCRPDIAEVTFELLSICVTPDVAEVSHGIFHPPRG